jgi:Spy/CpxP family protein refolding chaperone
MKAGKLLLALAAGGSLAFGTFALGVRAADNSNVMLADVADVTTQPASDHPLLNLIRGQIGRWMVLRSELDLSADQKQQIRSILESHKAEILQVLRPVVQKRQALRNAVIAPNADEAAIRAAADDLGHSIGDAAVLASKLRQQIAPILTDQQRQKIADFRTHSDQSVEEFFNKMSASVR